MIMPVIFDYMFVCSTAHLFSNPTWNSYSYHIILWCSWILLQIEDIFSLPTLWTPGFMGGCRWRNKTGELLNKQIVGDTGIPFPPNRILKSHMKHCIYTNKIQQTRGSWKASFFGLGASSVFFPPKKKGIVMIRFCFLEAETTSLGFPMFLWHVASTNCPRQAEIQQCPNPAEGRRGAQQKPGQLVGNPSTYVKGKTPREVFFSIQVNKAAWKMDDGWSYIFLLEQVPPQSVC